MAENFICVTQQILLLAAIILVGFALSKANLISAEGGKCHFCTGAVCGHAGRGDLCPPTAL